MHVLNRQGRRVAKYGIGRGMAGSLGSHSVGLLLDFRACVMEQKALILCHDCKYTLQVKRS